MLPLCAAPLLAALMSGAAPIWPLANDSLDVLDCAWGHGAAVPQRPPPPHSPVNLTCTPPSVVGAGSMSVHLQGRADGSGSGSNSVYLDAQMFSYHPKAPTPANSTGIVRLALLPMGGADGHSNLSASLRYLNKAGELGCDLAVLPENFAQKHIGKSGDMDPPPQDALHGPIISAVAAIAKIHGMNVVAPIREARGSQILNTAVVLDRSGAVVGRYSKLFPVLGPPGACIRLAPVPVACFPFAIQRYQMTHPTLARRSWAGPA
eukprot:COSAG01_NODE_3609_length_5876_cov_70.248572_4_plen_263_part_00